MTATVAARRRPAPMPAEGSPRRRSPRRAAFVVVVLLVGAATLAVVAFPSRTWWSQRQALTATERQLADLRAENAALDARIKALQTDDAAIEQLAREQYGMVRPGETAFAILPPPPPDDLPAGWPYDTLRRLVTRP